ncbi:hypothetical protein FOL47_011293 [Perkinsus chesapeaki]|uniref:Formyl transferase N-terminal domain-containing protein n=1 Tax=Perkinsus chesapeaki TaxID=330153 RepID=A0A7J6KZM5_PERCH|nr:hypothetical protein FOL47_011293 [Perkinsus chesapeaki]
MRVSVLCMLIAVAVAQTTTQQATTSAATTTAAAQLITTTVGSITTTTTAPAATTTAAITTTEETTIAATVITGVADTTTAAVTTSGHEHHSSAAPVKYALAVACNTAGLERSNHRRTAHGSGSDYPKGYCSTQMQLSTFRWAAHHAEHDFLSWGAAAAEALKAIREMTTSCSVDPAADEEAGNWRKVECLVVTHEKQSVDVDLSVMCAEIGFECIVLKDDKHDEMLLDAARDYGPHLLICVSYRRRIRSEVLELCPGKCVNFHPSLLPKHRGCFSSFHAIMDGDTHTGVTCHHIQQKYDSGNIIDQVTIEVGPSDTSQSLYRKLLPITKECIHRVLKQ